MNDLRKVLKEQQVCCDKCRSVVQCNQVWLHERGMLAICFVLDECKRCKHQTYFQVVTHDEEIRILFAKKWSKIHPILGFRVWEKIDLEKLRDTLFDIDIGRVKQVFECVDSCKLDTSLK